MPAKPYSLVWLFKRYVLLPPLSLLEAVIELVSPEKPKGNYVATQFFDITAERSLQDLPLFIFVTSARHDGEAWAKHRKQKMMRLSVILFLSLLVTAFVVPNMLVLLGVYIAGTFVVIAYFVPYDPIWCSRDFPFIKYNGHASIAVLDDYRIVFTAHCNETDETRGNLIPYTSGMSFAVGTYFDLLGPRPTNSKLPSEDHNPWVLIAYSEDREDSIVVAIHSGSSAEIGRLHAVLTNAFVMGYEANIAVIRQRLDPNRAPLETSVADHTRSPVAADGKPKSL